MEPLKIATVQFETRDNDKVYNLSIIREMCRKASVEGADVVAFLWIYVCQGLVSRGIVGYCRTDPHGGEYASLDRHRQRVWRHATGRIL